MFRFSHVQVLVLSLQSIDLCSIQAVRCQLSTLPSPTQTAQRRMTMLRHLILESTSEATFAAK